MSKIVSAICVWAVTVLSYGNAHAEQASVPPSQKKYLEAEVIEIDKLLCDRISRQPISGVLEYKSWRPSGRKLVEFREAECEFMNGLRDGSFKKFSSAGVLVFHERWAGGLLHGITTEFFEDGQRRAEYCYENGLRSGEYREWASSGRLIVCGLYRGGKKEGTWRAFDEDGNVSEMVVFADGVIRSRIVDGDDLAASQRLSEDVGSPQMAK